MSVAKSINPHISFLLARPSVMKNLSKTQVPKYSSKFNLGSGKVPMLFVVVEGCAGWYVLYVVCCGCWCCAGYGCTYGWADACVCGVGWGACALCLVALVLVALVLCVPLVVLALCVPLVLCVQPSDVWESDLSFLWGLLFFWTAEGTDELAAVVLCCVAFPATWVVFVATPAPVFGFLFSNSLTTISLIWYTILDAWEIVPTHCEQTRATVSLLLSWLEINCESLGTCFSFVLPFCNRIF